MYIYYNTYTFIYIQYTHTHTHIYIYICNQLDVGTEMVEISVTGRCFLRVSNRTWSNCENSWALGLFFILNCRMCVGKAKCIGKTRSGADRGQCHWILNESAFPCVVFIGRRDGVFRYNNNYHRNTPCGMIANNRQTEMRRPRPREVRSPQYIL